MSGLPRLHLLEDSLDRRVVAFPNYVEWQLMNKISEKGWEGSDEDERKRNANWQPDEAHAIYECVQIRGLDVGTVAIMKVRVEVPHDLPPKDDPRERANDASGLRLNYATKNEIKVLQILTATNCSATPRLLGYKIDVQDDSVLNSHGKPRFEAAWGRSKKWWMPGGYIVYILMAKLQAEPLDINTFWNENLFPSQKRAEVRARFQESYMELRSRGVLHGDAKLENLMWDAASQKCYIIDLESAAYKEEYKKTATWSDGQYFFWNLARRWAKPNW